MAASESPEASEIRRRGRQRLIGAVAIALLLIVFVPMLLDSEPRAKRHEQLEIPPRDNAPPLPAPRANIPDVPAKTAELKGAPERAEPKTAPEKTDAKPAPEKWNPEAKPTPKVAVVEPKEDASPSREDGKPMGSPPSRDRRADAKAASRMEGFAVQVGAFRDEAKLQQARDKLTAASINSYTEPSGELTRLRVGPFPTRDAAEKSAAAVRRAVGDAKVVPLP
jgi:DedD protein